MMPRIFVLLQLKWVLQALVETLKDDMGVSASKAKAVNTCSTRDTRWKRWPSLRRNGDLEIIVERGDCGAEFVEKKIWRDFTVLHSKRGFHDASYACCAFGVPDNSLDGADVQLVCGVVAAVTLPEERSGNSSGFLST